MSLDIRLARPDDRLDLIEVQRRASLAGEVDDVRRQLRERPELVDVDAELISGNQVFVAEEGRRVVGYASIVTHEGDDAELEGLFVEPTHWRQGIGSALVHQIEREARAWGANRLHVLANTEAASFYTAQGFERLGEQQTELGATAWLMAKPIR